ncbi:MAG: hypothetical protein ACFFHD_09585 [Promethearchaeota archaeon]
MESNSISLKKKDILNVDEFLDSCQFISNFNLDQILNLDFELDFYYKSEKVCPIIELAKPEDAKKIVDIFNEIYRGTYPYKAMEDPNTIREMIIQQNCHWFLFKLPSNEIVGCFGADLELNRKKAFLHGFIIRKQYQKSIDIFKAFIGCIIYLWKEYHEKIFLWYGEMRTNESISQFFTSLIGMKPIAFLPNKDIFLNKIESDILHVIFNKNVLREYRHKEAPRIIRQALNCYSYSNRRYELGLPIIENPNIILKQNTIDIIKKRIIKSSIKDKFGNEDITFYIKDLNSYFRFFHNRYSKNCEKTDYKVNNLEELYVFINELKTLIDESKINYFECFVSAYEPTHQKLFVQSGFKPRGYIPCWKLEKEKNIFEDQILFNFFKGNISREIKFIPESRELIENLQPKGNERAFDSLNIKI